MDGVKNAINVITPEETKIFQCISATTKNEWIDKFETALKFNQLKKKKSAAPPPPLKKKNSSTNKQQSTPSNVTKATAKLANNSSANSNDNDTVKLKPAPEWLVPVQEEIHTLIAQRHFEDALALITKCEEHFTKDSSFQNADEMIQKVSLIMNKVSRSKE